MYITFVDTVARNVPNMHAYLTDLDEKLAEPLGMSEDTWGTSPSAVAGHRAMIALAGPPARALTPEEVAERGDHRRGVAGTEAEDQL